MVAEAMTAAGLMIAGAAPAGETVMAGPKKAGAAITWTRAGEASGTEASKARPPPGQPTPGKAAPTAHPSEAAASSTPLAQRHLPLHTRSLTPNIRSGRRGGQTWHHYRYCSRPTHKSPLMHARRLILPAHSGERTWHRYSGWTSEGPPRHACSLILPSHSGGRCCSSQTPKLQGPPWRARQSHRCPTQALQPATTTPCTRRLPAQRPRLRRRSPSYPPQPLVPPLPPKQLRGKQGQEDLHLGLCPPLQPLHHHPWPCRQSGAQNCP